MIELSGKYNTAKVFTDVIDGNAMSQITEMCNQSRAEGLKIRLDKLDNGKENLMKC